MTLQVPACSLVSHGLRHVCVAQAHTWAVHCTPAASMPQHTSPCAARNKRAHVHEPPWQKHASMCCVPYHHCNQSPVLKNGHRGYAIGTPCSAYAYAAPHCFWFSMAPPGVLQPEGPSTPVPSRKTSQTWHKLHGTTHTRSAQAVAAPTMHQQMCETARQCNL